MPLPDICLAKTANEASAAIGIGDAGVSGGLSTTATIDSTGRVQQVGTIGNMASNRPTISAVTKQKVRYTIQFKKVDNTVVDLTNVDRIVFVAKETYNARTYYIEKDLAVTDAVNGITTLSLNSSDLPFAGVWYGALLFKTRIYESESESESYSSGGSSESSNSMDDLQQHYETITQYEVYLHVVRGMDSGENTNIAISIPEVRMALLDRAPSDNGLLDDFEFSDSEIAFSIMRPVDLWNETPPIISGHNFTAATFPYRYHHIEATCAELLMMASRRLIRNKLDYSAGGINVQDKARAGVYVQLSDKMRQEYKMWIKEEKARINAENCYGSIKSRIYF